MEIDKIIREHGYNLKLEVGNGLSKIEAENIIRNAVNEALDIQSRELIRVKSIGFNLENSLNNSGEFSICVFPVKTLDKTIERQRKNNVGFVPDYDGSIRDAIIKSLEPYSKLSDDCIINDNRNTKQQ